MCSYSQSGFTETLARTQLVDWLNLVSERGDDDDFRVCSSRRTVVVSWKEEKEHSVKHSAVKETLVERTYDLYDVPPQNEVVTFQRNATSDDIGKGTRTVFSAASQQYRSSPSPVRNLTKKSINTCVPHIRWNWLLLRLATLSVHHPSAVHEWSTYVSAKNILIISKRGGP